MECIILAGGLGTRLRGVIGNQPKCMAPVQGRPFLEHMFDYLTQQGCTRLILSLGHLYEVITDWLATQNRPFDIKYVIEQEPLGTGGGIRLAVQQSTTEQVIVLNGDTMFRISLSGLLDHHSRHHPETTLALKAMHRFERYGVVRMDEHQKITAFEEKKYYETGLINGGIYCIDRKRFLARTFPDTFSFEKDYLERYVDDNLFSGYVHDGYFIDIGIPMDYERAQYEM